MKNLIMMKGLPGAGKCLTENNGVVTDRGFLSIKDVKVGDKIISGRGSFENVVQTSNRLENVIYKATSKLNYSIEGSSNHPVYIFDLNTLSFKFKALEDITPNTDFLCYSTKEGGFSEKYVKVTPFNYKEIGPTAHSKSIKVPTILDEDLGYFLGYCVANASVSKTAVCFSSYNTKIKEHFIEISTKLFGITPHVNDKRVLLSSVKIISFLNHVNGEKWKTARYKTVPKELLKSPKSVQLAFITALFDCDSSCDKNYTNFEFSTASAVVARDVSTMLFNLGIINSHKEKVVKGYDHIYHSILFYGDFIKKYLTLVNSLKYHYYKVTKYASNNYLAVGFHTILIKAIQEERQRLGSNGGGFYLDVLTGKKKRFPNFHTMIRHLRGGNNVESKSPRYDILEEMLTDIEALKEKYKFLEEVYEIGQIYLDNKFYFSPIQNVEVIKKNMFVYDIEVENSHTFLANGAVVHNSTWAREYIASPMGKDTVRVNRDDIREMLYTLSSNPHRQHLEWPITKIEKDMTRTLLKDGFSVIVDATNLNKKCEKGFKKLAEENGATFSIVEMKTPIEECITRDQDRTRTVGEEVINGMAKRYHIK